MSKDNQIKCKDSISNEQKRLKKILKKQLKIELRLKNDLNKLEYKNQIKRIN